MANDFFTKAGVPGTAASLTSATIRAEFAAIEAAFDLFPGLAGNQGKVLRVNAGGTAVEAVTAIDLSSLTITGTLSVEGNVSLGDAAGDALTIFPNAVTWASNPTHSGNHTYSGTVRVAKLEVDDANFNLDLVASNPTITLATGSDALIYNRTLDQLEAYIGGVLKWADNAAGRYAVDGTNVLPAFSFISDTDTGAYLVAAGTMGFSAAGVKLAAVGATAIAALEGFSIFSDGSSGANLELVGDGATTPKKYIRAQSGSLQFLNDAYGAVIATLTDAGAFSANGNVSGSSLSAAGSVTVSGTSSSIPMPAFSAAPVTMTAGYTNQSVEVSKDSHGVVWCKGVANKDSVSSGSLTYFTFNSGYRPDQPAAKMIRNANDGAVVCVINTDGTVVVTHASSNNANTYFDFSFPTT